MTYTIILQPTEGGYAAHCPALPECRASGAGRGIVYRAIKAAIRRHLRACLQRGEPPPVDRTTIKFYRLDVRRLHEVEALR